MLDFMRRNANSWVMILIFAIIIFVFAINFGPWAGGQLSDNLPYAAKVNNIPISMSEFRTAYMSQIARIRQFRPDYDDEKAEKDNLKQLVLDQLISRELLTQLGRAQKFKVGAVTLATAIKDRVFGPEAEFNKEEYTRRIHAYFQSTVSQFEEQVEKELVAEQMANLLGTGVFISDGEAKTSFLDRNTSLAVEFVKVNPEFFHTKGASLNEITSFLEKNKDKVESYYNENIDKFVKEPEVKASHILIKVAPDAPAAEKAKQKARIEALLARIKKGEDFAKVAREESEDLGTKINGGDLDFFSAGKMVPEFSKAAFALKPDQVSEVVESPFGFHIIKVTDRTEEQKITLEKAANGIAETLITREQQKAEAKALAEQALAQLKAGVPLNKVNVPGLINKKVKGKDHTKAEPIADETSTFNRATPFIPGIGRADTFAEKAFSLNEANKTATEVFESNGQFFAIRLKEKTEADMSKFDAEKEKIKTALLYPRRRAFVQQYLTYLKNNAKITYNKSLLGTGGIKV